MSSNLFPADPPWFPELLAEVERAFEATGASTPGWPDPHPDWVIEDEEYSRVTDPGKYRILETRLDAWVRVLVAREVAAVEDVPAAAWRDGIRGPERLGRVRQLRPKVTGGLSLQLAQTLVDGAPFGFDLGLVGDDARPLLMTSIPGCGCDACDDGSASLLEEFDGWILTVARGGTVFAESSTGRANRRLRGSEGSGAVDVANLRAWLDESQPCPPGVTRWSGQSWL